MDNIRATQEKLPNERDITREDGEEKGLRPDVAPVIASIDPAKERKLVRKLDFRLVPIYMLYYLLAYLDRANIGNARIAGFEDDLNLKGYDFYIGLTVFYLGYSGVEIYANVFAKLLGVGKWLPLLMVTFGLITLCTSWIHNYGAYITVRLLMGIVEGGVIPGILFSLSMYYSRSELVFRAAFIISINALASAFGGLLAYGLLQVDIGSVKSWRTIFLIEGLITMVVGLITAIFVPDNPETDRWLTPEERTLAKARFDAKVTGTTNIVGVSKNVKWKMVAQTVVSPNVLICGFGHFCDVVSLYGFTLFLPTIIKDLYPGNTVVRTQLLTVPPFAVAWVWSLTMALFGAKYDTRGPVIMGNAVLAIISYIMFVSSSVDDTKLRYGAIFLGTSGIFSLSPFWSTWATNNASPDVKRGTAAGSINAIANLGGILATWSYLPSDAPGYTIGNSLNLGMSSLVFILGLSGYSYNRWENRQRELGKRDSRLDGLSEEEISLLGDKHPDYRYSY